MGKILFSFSKDGTVVTDFSDFDNARFYQHYQKKYPLIGIEKIIEFNGDDVLIDIDLNTFDDNSWNKIAYPTEEVRQTISLLLGYQKAFIELSEIEQTITKFGIDDSPNELNILANRAKNIIASLTESNLLANCYFVKDLQIKNLEHSIDQELKTYLGHNSRDSQKRRGESLRHAKNNLSSDIYSVISTLKFLLDGNKHTQD
jgi:hypothetical protein